MRNGFASVTNVIAGLWSSEVMHMARIRSASFSSVCPDDRSAFDAWWNGATPPSGTTNAFILLDPISIGTLTRRSIVGLEEVLHGSIRPRYRGYADAVDALRSRGSI